jgi:predicted ATPase
MKKNISNIGINNTNNKMALHTTYEVRWKNFKGFKDTGWIKIKPITVLIGSNNSGKTSFLAPFLLMNQTIASRDTSTPLIIKGNIYDGGNIKELMHGYELKDDIFFGFKYHTHPIPKKVKKLGTYPPGSFEVTFGINDEVNRDMLVKDIKIYDIYDRPFFSFNRNTDGQYELDNSFFINISNAEREGIKKSTPLNFLFTPNSLLYPTRELMDKDESQKIKRFTTDFSQLLQAVSFNYSLVRDILGDISYLGPIRENPHRYYEVSNENYETVGFKGENMANILKRNSKKIKKDIDEWIRKFGFGDDVELRELSKTVYYIVFNDYETKKYTTIANAGFGASQILPLIIQAYVSKAESLTIAEQPEIHLNPRLQSVLADLFAFMANKDQRIIIETHSEHLLLRLRRLVANQTIKNDDIAIYFIEKQHGISTIREIKIENDGAILTKEWPKGFFEETLRESLALASDQAKNRKK